MKELLSYKNFKEKLDKKIKLDTFTYVELLKSTAQNPERFVGVFRLTNAKTKLLQFFTQSNEIKLGAFIEDIVTEYLSLLGYENLPKHIGSYETEERGRKVNKPLLVDQLFKKGDAIYIIEQKIRDDHDSTKKQGQVQNFERKIKKIRELHPNNRIKAFMWFVDNGLKKNKNYYEEELLHIHIDNVSCKLFYNGDLFSELNSHDVWKELISHLLRVRQENTKETITIPDFSNDNEIYKALLELDEKYFKKIVSDENIYKLLRDELFNDGDNLQKAIRNRKK